MAWSSALKSGGNFGALRVDTAPISELEELVTLDVTRA